MIALGNLIFALFECDEHSGDSVSDDDVTVLCELTVRGLLYDKQW